MDFHVIVAQRFGSPAAGGRRPEGTKPRSGLAVRCSRLLGFTWSSEPDAVVAVVAQFGISRAKALDLLPSSGPFLLWRDRDATRLRVSLEYAPYGKIRCRKGLEVGFHEHAVPPRIHANGHSIVSR